jgi:hypothetical protein
MLANCREALPERGLGHVTVHDIGLTVLRDPPNPIAEYAHLLAYLGCKLIQGQVSSLYMAFKGIQERRGPAKQLQIQAKRAQQGERVLHFED